MSDQTPERDVVGAAADALTLQGGDLPPAERQLLRLWLALIDGTVPDAHVNEAWDIAKAIQSVYHRKIEEGRTEGHAAGITAATEAERQAGYAAGWMAAITEIMGHTGLPARTAQGNGLDLLPS